MTAMEYKELPKDVKNRIVEITVPENKPIGEWTDEQLFAEYFRSDANLDNDTLPFSKKSYELMSKTAQVLETRGYSEEDVIDVIRDE